MPYELLLTDSKLIKRFKTKLECENKYIKPIFRDGPYKVIRTSITDNNDPLLRNIGSSILREYIPQVDSGKSDENKIVGFTRSFLEARNVLNIDELIESLPARYTIYTPLLLFNNSKEKSYNNKNWIKFFESSGAETKKRYFDQLLSVVFPNSELTHVAINMPITETDVMRRPFNIYPLYGALISPALDLTRDSLWDHPTQDDFQSTLWCHTVQNGIHQYWAPVFTMFSRGNIKEKKRILDTFRDIKDNDVVDLYAGIGYFTLSYLKRDARNVYCFELNPWSTEALQKGIKGNKIDPRRCHIFNETNENCIRRIASLDLNDLKIRHINMGLLPTSKPSWPLSLEIIALQNKFNPIRVVSLHIHENVHISQIDSGSFVNETLCALKDINPDFSYHGAHLEKIKTFAPDVWHICFDIDVTCDA